MRGSNLLAISSFEKSFNRSQLTPPVNLQCDSSTKSSLAATDEVIYKRDRSGLTIFGIIGVVIKDGRSSLILVFHIKQDQCKHPPFLHPDTMFWGGSKNHFQSTKNKTQNVLIELTKAGTVRKTKKTGKKLLAALTTWIRLREPFA